MFGRGPEEAQLLPSLSFVSLESISQVALMESSFFFLTFTNEQDCLGQVLAVTPWASDVTVPHSVFMGTWLVILPEVKLHLCCLKREPSFNSSVAIELLS